MPHLAVVVSEESIISNPDTCVGPVNICITMPLCIMQHPKSNPYVLVNHMHASPRLIPGMVLQKEMLFKEWADYNNKYDRCPKNEEIESFSNQCFEKRRRELEDEDRDHPLLVILEEPLDATQVKNLINNEKKKRHRAPNSSFHPGIGCKTVFTYLILVTQCHPIPLPSDFHSSAGTAFPFAVLQGLPLTDAAIVMKGWLQSQQEEKTCDSNDKLTKTHTKIPSPHLEVSSASEQSGEASYDKFIKRDSQEGPMSQPITPRSMPGAFRRKILAATLTPFTLDGTSEDESETHDLNLADPKGISMSQSTSGATVSRMDYTDTSSRIVRPKHLQDLPKVVQSTAGEVLGMALFQKNHSDALAQSIPMQLLSDCQPGAPLNTLQQQHVAMTPLAQSIASAAVTACNQALSTMLGQNSPVNLFQIQQLVKSVVDEQVHKAAARQQAQLWQWQQQQPPLSQFWQVMQMIQGLQGGS